MDTLKLAWKVVAFYDLTPQTLARLTRTYGLQECGGLTEVEGAERRLPALHRHLIRGMAVEDDPRVRFYLRHQLSVSRQAQALRARGYHARVRGWLIAVRGGKKAGMSAQSGRAGRRKAHGLVGRREGWEWG